MIVYNNKLYLLTFKYDEETLEYDTKIYVTEDLVSFEEVYNFTADTMPYAFEIYNDEFYVGTIYSENADKNRIGTLYKIYKD